MHYLRLFLLSCWRSSARFFWIIPKSHRDQQLLDQLRSDFGKCSSNPRLCDGGDLDVGEEWAGNLRRLHVLVMARDPRAFLTWDVIIKTMFIPFARFVSLEFAFLKRRPDWTRWRSAIRERWAGFPFLYPFYPLSSCNAIHHAYHFSLLEDYIGRPLSTFGTICEFGGGYGSMCRIARELGFSDKYIIYDLPEFAALQRYYLGLLRIEAETMSDTKQLAAATERCEQPSLFVAAWSLSESPNSLQQQILELVAGFDAFLIAYQDEFDGQGNTAFFEGLPSKLPNLSWEIRPISHLPGNSYLFGWRKPR
jgi:hypothetical protein